MRVFAVSLTLLLIVAAVAAQAPTPRPVQQPARRAAVRASSVKPDGTLAQLMRGILFPNSNLLFAVQENDPGAPKKPDAGADGSHDYSNVYTGWEVVESAAVALEESADLIMRPGRLCSNGRPAPIGRPDYMKFVQDLREAGRRTLAAAQAKSQDRVTELTNDIADACSSCHEVYRDKGPAGSPARCMP
jgi:cytochrome c556